MLLVKESLLSGAGGVLGNSRVILPSSSSIPIKLSPNFNALQEMDRGFIITAKAPPEITEYDFVSRVFDAPAGINEDSVTGNAHCASAPYWSKTLGNELIGYQASKRGGFVKCTYENDVTKLNGCCVLMVRMNDADILNLITEC
jgi:predicted PhzF superfamily epimerase YddE/YHI9